MTVMGDAKSQASAFGANLRISHKIRPSATAQISGISMIPTPLAIALWVSVSMVTFLS